MSNITLQSKLPLTIFGAGTVHSDGTTYSREFTNYYHKGIYLYVDSTADSGTSTLDGQLQHRSPILSTWTNLENASIVQFADATFELHTLYLYPGIIGGDTDGTLIVNTDHKFVEGFLPLHWRYASTVGGTTVTRTGSVVGVLLP